MTSHHATQASSNGNTPTYARSESVGQEQRDRSKIDLQKGRHFCCCGRASVSVKVLLAQRKLGGEKRTAVVANSQRRLALPQLQPLRGLELLLPRLLLFVP